MNIRPHPMSQPPIRPSHRPLARLSRLLPLCFVLASAGQIQAAVSFFDDFDSYTTGPADAAFASNYFSTLTPAIAATSGLGGSKSVENSGDLTFVRKAPAINLLTSGENVVTLDIFFQWGGSAGLASPQLGVVGADTGVFNSGTAGDVSGRINNAGTLELRSNNTELTRGATLVLTSGNWYDLRAVITRTATTNQFDITLGLYNSSTSGVVGSLVDSLSSTAFSNATLYGDTTLYAAARENSSVPRIDNFGMTQIPEPAGALLALCGLLAVSRRRRGGRRN